MSTISQRIPNLLLGVSQQPDKLKFPGQVVEASNVFPDYALGLLKRPGGKFEAELYNATARGRWFPILRDNTEKYVCQYDTTDGQFRVWGLLDGQPRAVDMGTNASTGNPSGCNFSDAAPTWSSTVTGTVSTSGTTNAITTLFDGDITTIFKATGGTSLTIDWQSTEAVPYETLEVYVDAQVSNVNYRSVTTTTSAAGWHTIASSANTLDSNNDILLTSNVVGETPGIAAIRINGTTILKDADTSYRLRHLTDYRTALNSKATELSDLHAAQATRTETNDGQNSTKESLFQVDVTYKNGYYEEMLKSGVLERIDDGQRIVKDNTLTDTTVAVVAKGGAMPNNYALGNDRTVDYPWLKRDGYRVYEVEKTIAATHTSAQLTAANTAMTAAQTAYDNAVTEETTQRGNYDTEVTSCAIGSNNIPDAAYLKDATADDIEILTINDYTFVLNKNKTTAMKTTTSPAQANEAFVVIKTIAYNADYSVTIDTHTTTHNTPESVTNATLDSGSIATALATAINANTNLSYITATAIGPGVYISGTQAFDINTAGSSSDEGIYVFQDKINVASRLPNQCENGYIVRVTNTDVVAVDDVYVEFQTTNNAARGPGVWEETIGPGLQFEIDETTMPHQLVRQSNGSFKYEPVNWTDRLVGDNDTNPIPSFIGKKINNLFFFRNRLGMLSNEAVIMSRAGDYFNFFANSSQAIAADDPIDIQATSIRPVTLNYTLTTSVGLLVFGPNEQFLLSTDADIMSPSTAKINTISSFECDDKIDAVSVGTAQAFISKSNLFSKLFMMLNVQRDSAASIDEATANVPEYVPSDIDTMVSSPAMSITSLGKSGSNTVYQHRFFVQGDNRVQSWYKWQLTGDLRLQFFDKSTFYAVTSSGTNVYLTSYDLTQASESGFLTLPTGEKTDVCLDMFNINPDRTYNDTTKKTTVNLPFDHITGKKLAVVVIGTYIGDTDAASSEAEGTVSYFEDADITNDTVELNGDFRGRDLIIGYVYDMDVQLPVFYTTQREGQSAIADVTASLILHRIKVSTGLSGPITYKVAITGKDTWNEVINVTMPYTYVLNNVNLSASATHDVPIYQRNENLKINIIGDTPYPVSLLNIVWEGNYNRRFYSRQ